MIMKRIILLSVLFGAMPFVTMAQDDLYFSPSENQEESSKAGKDIWNTDDSPAYYSGIDKSTEEYNRRGAFSYKKIGTDSLGNDIIRYRLGTDSYVVDTVYAGLMHSYETNVDDFAYSRRMEQFEGFWGRYNPWYIGSPYYYSSWGYWDPWYNDFYAPWYYSSWHYGWGYPWAYRYNYWGWDSPYYYGFNRPYYPGGSYYYSNNGTHTGTANHWGNGRSYENPTIAGRSNSNFSGYRGNTANNNGTRGFSRGRTTIVNRNNGFAGSRRPSRNSQPTYQFGTSRTYTPTQRTSPNITPRSSNSGFNSNSSFGGSRSFGGGSRSGSTGSRNRTSFGGRR